MHRKRFSCLQLFLFWFQLLQISLDSWFRQILSKTKNVFVFCDTSDVWTLHFHYNFTTITSYCHWERVFTVGGRWLNRRWNDPNNHDKVVCALFYKVKILQVILTIIEFFTINTKLSILESKICTAAKKVIFIGAQPDDQWYNLANWADLACVNLN